MPRHKFNLGDIVKWHGKKHEVVKVKIINFNQICYELDVLDSKTINEEELEAVK